MTLLPIEPREETFWEKVRSGKVVVPRRTLSNIRGILGLKQKRIPATPADSATLRNAELKRRRKAQRRLEDLPSIESRKRA